MNPKVDALAKQLLGTIKDSLTSSANSFIAGNAEIKGFIERKVLRSAELAVDYAEASEADRPAIAENMLIVNQTITNETIAVLLQVEPALKDTILGVLKSVFFFVLQNLPTILALIPK